MTVTPEMVTAVKSLLSMTGSFDEIDAAIERYIAAVEDYMLGAGVPEAAIEAHPGTVARGVDDMYINNAGGSDFSPMFRNMVIQLALRNVSSMEKIEETAKTCYNENENSYKLEVAQLSKFFEKIK